MWYFVLFPVFFSFRYFFGGASPCSVWDLSSQTGIKPMSPALEAQNLNHWTSREVFLIREISNDTCFLNKIMDVECCKIPVAAVTNHHKLSGLKQHKWIIF